MSLTGIFSKKRESLVEKPPFSCDNLGIVIVDMQNYFLTGRDYYNAFPEAVHEMIACQLEVIAAARKRQIPIYVLEYQREGKSPEATIGELDAALTDYEKVEVFKKKHDDGFKETDLEKKLNELEVKEILLMGVNAAACVHETASSALRSGLKIVTCRQLMCHEGRELSKNDDVLQWYRQRGKYFEDYRKILEVIRQR